jgi:hypothetical protein
MKKVVENWRIILSGDDYDAPEIRRFHLQGEASWEDGEKKLTSSSIVGSEKDGNQDVIITRSGTRYYLGKPEHNGIRSLEEMRQIYPWVPVGK